MQNGKRLKENHNIFLTYENKKGSEAKMLKIFVTGDNHIGMKYAGHEKSEILKAKRIEAFEKMVSEANREECDLFVITGDLFQDTYQIKKKDIKTILEMLSEFNGVIAVLPGNHDYYNENTRLWKDFNDLMLKYEKDDKILLLKEYRPYRFDIGENEVVLYPALCKTAHSATGENNLGWIKETQIKKDGAYHIGVAHGAVEGETADKDGQYFLMTRAELESIPVDAWLIGHTHVPFPRNLTENFEKSGKIFNPGTHVQTDVSRNTEGLCFVVCIDDDKTVRAKKFVSGNLRFFRKEITVSANEMEETITRELSKIPENSVVEVILKGAVNEEEYKNCANIVKKCFDSFNFVETGFDANGLCRFISKQTVESEFAETSFSAKLLTALLDEPKEAQLMYDALKGLKEGK